MLAKRPNSLISNVVIEFTEKLPAQPRKRHRQVVYTLLICQLIEIPRGLIATPFAIDRILVCRPKYESSGSRHAKNGSVAFNPTKNHKNFEFKLQLLFIRNEFCSITWSHPTFTTSLLLRFFFLFAKHLIHFWTSLTIAQTIGVYDELSLRVLTCWLTVEFERAEREGKQRHR